MDSNPVCSGYSTVKMLECANFCAFAFWGASVFYPTDTVESSYRVSLGLKAYASLFKIWTFVKVPKTAMYIHVQECAMNGLIQC